MAHVFVAMSGGVDSSAAALLLQRAGHQITGVHLRLFREDRDGAAAARTDEEDAAAVARRLGFPFQVVIISVEDDRETLLAHIRQTLQEAEEILGLPFPGSLEEACVVDDTFRGEGWSVNTPASSRMVGAFARREGILVENVYNSKVLVGMEAYIRDGRVPGAACYLHTGGFGSLFAQY